MLTRKLGSSLAAKPPALHFDSLFALLRAKLGNKLAKRLRANLGPKLGPNPSLNLMPFLGLNLNPNLLRTLPGGQ